MSDQIERQCPDCTDTVCCICQGINESCLDMPSHPGPSRDKKRIKELEAEIARLTDSEDSRRPERGKRPSMYNDRLAELVAENKRLRAECVEYDEANTDLGIALAEARAELDRTKPVVDAAEEWYAAFEYEELDENYSAEERVLFNTIKANPSCPSCGPGGCAGHTRKPSEVERKLPVCAQCGHRHRWGGECADHSWTDSCPYGAGADCEAVAEERLRCPETLLMSPDEVIVIRCVRDGGHEGNHWNRDREVEWEPIVAAVEVACPRCGGADGTHTFRDCKTAARYPHAKCTDKEPHNSHVWGDPEHWCAGVWTTTAVVAETALLRQELGLSSTDTTPAGAADV